MESGFEDPENYFNPGFNDLGFLSEYLTALSHFNVDPVEFKLKSGFFEQN